jgi:AraC-like DNA-binding protein
VEVLARLSAPFLSHLRVVAGREYTLTAVESWDALAAAVRSHPSDVVVVDPRDGGGMRIDALGSLLARYPSLPVVVYTMLSPEAMRASVELAKFGVHHVVLRGYDDEPRRFRTLLERLPAYALSEQVLAGLAVRLECAPPALLRAVERLFRSPHAFHDVQDLAVAAGMTRRSLDRWLDRTGIAPAKMLVIGARLLRAYHYMRDPGYLLEDVAAKLGYPTARLFARQMRLATGLMPSAVRARVAPDRFVATLGARLCQRDGRPGNGW